MQLLLEAAHGDVVERHAVQLRVRGDRLRDLQLVDEFRQPARRGVGLHRRAVVAPRCAVAQRRVRRMTPGGVAKIGRPERTHRRSAAMWAAVW